MSETIGRDLEPWQWDEPTWRGHVSRVRAGARLVPERLARRVPGPPWRSPSTPTTRPSRCGTARRGRASSPRASTAHGSRCRRILRLLARARAFLRRFFMPAVSALLHPDEVARLRGGRATRSACTAGSTSATRCSTHADELDLHRAAPSDTLEKLGGHPAGGHPHAVVGLLRLTPSAIIEELGLAYDSSLMADDDPYELVADGRPTGIVEIPVEWIRDDAPYLMMDRYGGAATVHAAARRPARDLARRVRRRLRARAGVFQLTLHPHIIGHRSRLGVLRELLDAHHEPHATSGSPPTPAWSPTWRAPQLHSKDTTS